MAAYESYGTPGAIVPSEEQKSAARRGYYDYLLHGPSYAQDYKRTAPKTAWHYLAGVTAARRGEGLYRALHTLTLAHVPGASYHYQDGFKSSNPSVDLTK